jgi:hypothetical protein
MLLIPENRRVEFVREEPGHTRIDVRLDRLSTVTEEGPQ